MIAEINNKIPSKLSNSEDLLTGNFFGIIRYTNIENTIPCIFESSTFNKTEDNNIFDKALKSICKTQDPFIFWPKFEGNEIDLIIELSEYVIGIEIKYNSGLSSDDEVSNLENNEIQNSCNQLSRYSRMLENKYPLKKKILLFLAKENSASHTYYAVLNRNIISNNVSFGFLSWQEILISLQKYNSSSNELIIINDLIKYLNQKGFDTFKSFFIKENISRNSFFKFNFNEKFSFQLKRKIFKLSYKYE
ncbi:hypothetical protein EC396_11420 [Lutibacter sp. HS1-25]|uniref:hypothetical protein n=1 Tax=Lutibacter sp. HS1-25 TaxID=2485000 RepID=UPI0010102C90|nr:hypothetical protein [Lutibacter sp. HS1-25]RXP52257.1 hypothetical protein EC396_11420 [Lutibacter sp. HS1-25]